jgi:hypothetical protein
MSMEKESTGMARRALLTEGEREALLNPETKDNPYVAVSRVRKKIQQELPHDVEVLREHSEKHDGDLLEELRSVVCQEPARHNDNNAAEPRSVGRDPQGEQAEDHVRDRAEEKLRAIDLAGTGSKYEARMRTILEFFDHLRANEGERVTKGDFEDLVQEQGLDIGYASFESLWGNWVKKNDSQGRHSNTLTQLPGVEMDGDDYVYTGEA